MWPVLEDDISRDGSQVLEEAISRTARDNGGTPGEDAKISGGVECEGKQIEGDENARQGFLAVPEVVLEIVSVGLEHVEGVTTRCVQNCTLRREASDHPFSARVSHAACL
jgi:hypothetical protein